MLGVHGALPEEQDRAQPFEVDLDVEADLAVAGSTDRLSDTVDYGALTAVAAMVVSGERFRLLERLAERIASAVMGVDPRVRAVTVTVCKLRPPLAADLSSAGVRIHRERPPATGGDPAGPAGPGEPVTRTGVPAPGSVTGSGRRRALVGLGSNLGHRMATLRAAVAGLPDVVAVSPVYETEPVGGPDGQPRYLNVVAELATDLTARQLLDVAHRLETAAGRERAERFGPRTLDVDILLVGDEIVDEPDLTVPHPRMHERRFVLAPLADLATGEVRVVGRLEVDERHPSGPEREETT